MNLISAASVNSEMECTIGAPLVSNGLIFKHVKTHKGGCLLTGNIQ